MSLSCCGAGAYIATLIKLDQLLRPCQMPAPAAPSSQLQQLKRKWDPLQWQFSFFDDLKGEFSDYSKLKPSKYAIKVMQPIDNNL